MRILVTNDDGIEAKGLSVLVEALQAIKDEQGNQKHEIFIVAPDGERSGVSHSMTLQRPARVRKLADHRYSCSGTPADCVIIAGLWLLDRYPDVVISGINAGPNLGNDIIYSGTCGAARQAAFAGIPAIAVSCASIVQPLDYHACASFIADNLERLIALWRPQSFVNVNGPSSSRRNLGTRWTHPGNNSYKDTLDMISCKNGDMYCLLGEGTQQRAVDLLSDHQAIVDGLMAIGLVGIHPVSVHDPALDGKPVF